MALLLNLKYVENLRGKGDRLAKVVFRGVAHYSKICENADEKAVFDETFEWPVARVIESDEQVEIQVFNYNKYLSNRLVGTFCMVLQQLVEVGQLRVSDCLLDDNNVVMKTCVTFELVYNAPDGSVSTWPREGFDIVDGIVDEDGHTNDDQRLIAHEKGSDSESAASSPRSRLGSKISVTSRGSQGLKSPTSAIKSIKSIGKIMKFRKQRPPPDQPTPPPSAVSRDSIARETDGPDLGFALGDNKDDDAISDTPSPAKKSKKKKVPTATLR